MTASSPPTRRVVEVVELLVERHTRPTRLSDVVSALGINKATASAVLAELCDSGWIARDPADKTFTIGDGLTRVARRLDPSATLTRAARAAATAARDTGYAASVSERDGDELVITAFVPGHDHPWHASAGDRVPFAAPYGPAYAAWESDAERRSWTARSGIDSATFAATVEQQLDQTRAAGFSVEQTSPEALAAIPFMTKLHTALSPTMREHLNEVLVELVRATPGDTTEPRDQYVAVVAAPIFDSRGRVAYNLCLHPFTTLTAPRIAELGRHLRATADTLT
ncbi:helix-turn-helix domain-containing protein [Nocardia sp. alder85J]|uniref:helix-turn-helix domain-containing protein n=1 Tax=Nocardia sp. alder85J TaxID=2862949 RepID=UPI001CD47632|nr:helix-turn-helix domain-containing protein [Nocardia sp. alder85J]MCX4096750.1 transcriptional regulator [Nocardia sp. alder85J]